MHSICDAAAAAVATPAFSSGFRPEKKEREERKRLMGFLHPDCSHKYVSADGERKKKLNGVHRRVLQMGRDAAAAHLLQPIQKGQHPFVRNAESIPSKWLE